MARNGKAVPDLTDRRFGWLVAKERVRTKRGIAYRCECDCSRSCIVMGYDLASGKRESCGRWDHSVLGRRFGKLVVKSLERSDADGLYLRCECDCTRQAVVSKGALVSGAQTSCGCVHAEKARARAAENLAKLEEGYVDGTCIKMLGNRPPANNSTGVRGVSYRPKTGTYVAYIGLKGKKRHLGSFRTLAEAAEARREAEQELFDPVLEAHGREPTSESSYEDALRKAAERESS